MNPEKKVVTKSTAIRLEDAGFPQDCERSYCVGHTWYEDDRDHGSKYEECENPDLLDEDRYCHTQGMVCEDYVAAPDAQEIGHLLPDHWTIQKKGRKKILGKWVCMEFPTTMNQPSFYAYNEAEARAACWLWLKENKLI